MSDRVAVFNDGVIQQLSSPDVLYESPQNSFVAQFIGENNKLSGNVTAVNGTTCDVSVGEGISLKADPVNISGVGSPTTLSLRPERVELQPDTDMDNIVDGRVEELVYLGDHIRVRMNVAGNAEFVVKVRNRGERRKIAAGETVKIGWAASDCKALDAVA
jgi:putative spermidine/putrescine transport system ATP-binding protein